MKGVWLSIILLAFALPAGALTSFTINETDTLSLAVNASDPDNDNLVITYGFPLNESGVWQPTYGDAGVYKTNITVSDGDSITVEQVLLAVSVKPEAPSIDAVTPIAQSLNATEGDSLLFSIQGSDLNNDPLTYDWFLDGVFVSNAKDILFRTSYSDQGVHAVVVQISDGVFTINRTWIVSVQDVDLDALLLTNFVNQTISEGDRLSIDLPDFDFYNIEYSLSNPLQNNNWETDFSSGGTYPITLSLAGDGYSKEHMFVVTVEEVDRDPEFVDVPIQYTKEQQEVSFTVSATDPDNDSITIVATQLPDDATFTNNTFSWTPEYGIVKSGGIIRAILHRLHLLNWKETAVFEARSRNSTDSLKVPIVVLNRNRAPTLELPDFVEVTEGEKFVLNVTAYDDDSDRITYSYEGFVKPGQIVGFDQAGRHVLKVTVSDGHLEDVEYVSVRVNPANRPPTLDSLADYNVAENNTLSIPLSTSDPDKDDIKYTLRQAPAGMSVTDGVITWVPSYDSTTKGVVSRYNVQVIASDGVSESSQWLAIDVTNVNRPPQQRVEESVTFTAVKNEPVLLEIPVVDLDRDELTGKWIFSSRDRFEGLAHQRTFISSGEKSGSFLVSDGEEEILIPFTILVE